jgi:hypothetical protein
MKFRYLVGLIVATIGLKESVNGFTKQQLSNVVRNEYEQEYFLQTKPAIGL